MITAAKNDYHSYLESSERTILELALKIASKIVAIKIEDDQYFLSLVKKAVKEVRNFSETQIHVHPNQYEFLLSKKEELLSIFTQDTNLVIYPDSDLSEGCCLIESPSGRIDAGIDTQLTEIKNALIESLEGASMKASSLLDKLDEIDTYRRFGRVKQVVGLMIESQGPESSIGDLC